MADNGLIPQAQADVLDASGKRFTISWFRFFAAMEGVRKAISDGVATALLKANNLDDVASPATAFANIKQAASGTTTGVVQQTQKGSVTFQVLKVANQAYTPIFNSPNAKTITKITTKSASGTCTLTGTIGGVSLGGSANSVSSSEVEQTHSSANVVAVGGDLDLTASSNSACLNMKVTVEYTYNVDA